MSGPPRVTRFDPAPGPLRGELTPPPDKSISHRAALIGAVATGPTRIEGYLDSADTRSTLSAVAAIGAEVTVREGEAGLDVEIEGRGLRDLEPAAIDVGNAGTLLRLLPGLLAGQPGGEWTLDGDESIRRRPVDRVAAPLTQMGAQVQAREERLPPLRLRGRALRGIDYELPVASAQVKSCLLFAGMLAEDETVVREPVRSRDHTERMLAGAGAAIGRDGDAISIATTAKLDSADMRVPGDFSSAAFPLVAALLVEGSDVGLCEVGLNLTRLGLMPILARMGVPLAGAPGSPDADGAAGAPGRGSAAVTVERIRDAGPEPYGHLRVTPWALKGAEIGPADVPFAIDELPLVALLACFAEGETTVRGAGELRHKESDRIAGVAEGLRGLGAEIEATPDGFAVAGGGPGSLRGGELDARGDHRLAMMGAVAGLASREGVEVRGFDAVQVSYPGFEADLRSLAGG